MGHVLYHCLAQVNKKYTLFYIPAHLPIVQTKKKVYINQYAMQKGGLHTRLITI